MSDNKKLDKCKLDVLNKGYVRLVDALGDDTTIVNAARVSYNKSTYHLRKKDKGLIKFLAKNGHTSPFRHGALQFEVYAPLMVARQWWKYVVGSDHVMDGWNESSRRYVTEEPTFYVPNIDEWREKPDNSKQGSGDYVNEADGETLTNELERVIMMCEEMYQVAIERGIAPEQARLFLPAYGMYVRWYWTGSLQSVAHFISQRVEHDAQKEIQEYAKAVKELSMQKFPFALGELLEADGE